jgi:hypothetical protein
LLGEGAVRIELEVFIVYASHIKMERLRRLHLEAGPASEHDEGIKLVKRILEEIGVESFLAQHKDSGVTRTALFDYKAGRIEGRVSPEKCALIKAAAIATAAELGL